MSIFDILNLIPQGLQQQALDALVDFVSGQAKRLLGKQVSEKVQVRGDFSPRAYRRKAV